MNSVLSKPSELINIDDIQELIRLRIPEGEQIEYKRGLSRKGDGKPDNWLSGGNLGDRAKKSLIKEVVALINTSGGVILLGVGESTDKPPVANEIVAVRRCADLADALSSLLPSRIEPQIPPFEIIPIETEGEDGVVVIRVRESQNAPHRDTSTSQCYARRHDKSSRMSMREIQDMTMNSTRGLEGLDRRFARREELFENELNYLIDPDDAFGIRITAIPIGNDVWFDRVYDNHRVVPQLEFRKLQVIENTKDGRKEKIRTIFDNYGFSWKPALRAARGDSDSTIRERRLGYNAPASRYNFYVEIHCDGIVELGLVTHQMHTGDYK